MNKLISKIALIILICNPLYSSDRYVGFSAAVSDCWDPGLGFTMKKSKLLERMRLEGPYVPKEMAAHKEWRQSTFESYRGGDYLRNTANSISYPLNSIAAFIQWCYPCPGGIMLEPNSNCNDPLGTLAKLWNDNREQASLCFSVLIKIMDDLYSVDFSDFEYVAPDVRADITNTFPNDTPRLSIFLDILIEAVYLERFERPVYYPVETVRKTFISYLTDIIHDKAELVGVYRKAGLLQQDPVNMSMTKEEYDLLNDELKKGPTWMIGTFVQFLILQDQFCSELPPFLRMDRSKVEIGSDDIVSFADCGETSFMNFCLTFLWGQQKINPERWSTLKEQYPNFKPFVDFFETYKTIADIEKNRSKWATLMAFQKPLTETLFNKITYNRRGKAELIGGNPSFLNLMSILFAENDIMQLSFETEKLASQDDMNLAQKKWRKLIEILSCHHKYGPRLDEEQSSFKSNAELHFSLGVEGNKSRFRFDLQKDHFSLDPTLISAPRAIDYCKREDDEATQILLGYGHTLVNTHTPFFFMSEHELPTSLLIDHKNKIVSMSEHKEITMVVRKLMRFSQNRMDDDYVIKRLLAELNAWYPDESVQDILNKLVKHPLGKVFLYKYIAPNVLIMGRTQEGRNAKSALQSVLTNSYFQYMLESSHPNKYQFLCFYGQPLGALEKIKRSPNHPAHNVIFKGPLHGNHPLMMAAKNNQIDIINLITDNGNADFWKVKVETDFEERLLLFVGIQNPEMLRFLIQKNPETFEMQKRIYLFVLLGECSVESYDMLFKFLCNYHQFSKKELLEYDCRDLVNDEEGEIDFLDMLLCQSFDEHSDQWEIGRKLIQKTSPDYRVPQSVLRYTVNQLLQCNRCDRISDVLSYAEPDVIREALEKMPFDAALMQCSMQGLEILYPYFSNKTWGNFLNSFFSEADDTLTWRALHSLFMNMEVPHDFKMTIKEMLIQKKGESKLFLLGLFSPDILPQNYGEAWKIECQTLLKSALPDMQIHLPMIREQMDRLTTVISGVASQVGK